MVAGNGYHHLMNTQKEHFQQFAVAKCAIYGVIGDVCRFSRGRFMAAAFASSLGVFVLTGGLADALAASASQARPQVSDTSLATLYERLGKAKSDDEARQIEAVISRGWLRSGSATADLLLTRAYVALGVQDPALAIELLDRVIALTPDWAEAYARRGEVLAALGDSDRAVADFNQVLIRDDRHFVVLQALAGLFAQAGAKEGALKLYERALAINPHLEGGQKALEKLRLAVEGQPL